MTRVWDVFIAEGSWKIAYRVSLAILKLFEAELLSVDLEGIMTRLRPDNVSRQLADAVALDELAIQILARQQPVARDLRIVVTALRVSASLERMGDMATHIAQLARYRFPEKVVPKGLRKTFQEMGALDCENGESGERTPPGTPSSNPLFNQCFCNFIGIGCSKPGPNMGQQSPVIGRFGS